MFPLQGPQELANGQCSYVGAMVEIENEVDPLLIEKDYHTFEHLLPSNIYEKLDDHSYANKENGSKNYNLEIKMKSQQEEILSYKRMALMYKKKMDFVATKAYLLQEKKLVKVKRKLSKHFDHKQLEIILNAFKEILVDKALDLLNSDEVLQGALEDENQKMDEA